MDHSACWTNHPLRRLALPLVNDFAKSLLATVVFGLLYVATAVYSLKLMAPPTGVALFWPAAGLACGLLIAFGRAFAAPVVIGTLAATLAANLLNDKSVFIGLGYGLANAAEALTIAYVATSRHPGPFRLDKFSEVITFFVAAAAGTGLSALISTAVTASSGSLTHGFVLEAWTWARSDFVGVIAVAPIIIVAGVLKAARVPLSEHVLAMALIAAIAVLAFVTFTTRIDGTGSIPSAALFIPLIALAFLTPSFYCVVGSTVVCSIIVVTVIAKLGGGYDPGHSVWSIIGFAQLAIIAVAAGALSLAALLGERRRMETELALQADHSKMLLREVTHRCKNLLAVVLSMARLAPRGASVEDFVTSYTMRVMAMGESLNLLIKESWQTVDLIDLVRVHMGGISSAANRIRVVGVPLALKPDVAQALGMAMYELFTNASKYGALSNERGTVSLSWSIVDVETIPTVRLIWQESGGPQVAAPKKSGFGTSVLKRVAPSAVSGEAELLYEPQGFSWILRGPLDGFTSVPTRGAQARSMSMKVAGQEPVEESVSGSNVHVLYADRGSGNR